VERPITQQTALLGVRIMILLTIGILITAYFDGVVGDLRVWGSALATGVTLLLLMLVRWTSLLDRPIGTVMLALLFAVFVAMLTAAGTIPRLESTILAADLAIVALSAAMAGLTVHGFVTVTAAASYVTIAITNGEPVHNLIVPVLAVAGVSFAVAALMQGFRSEHVLATERLDALTAREMDLERLYEVSTATSVAETVQEALPMLVGRIGQYLHAQVGALLLKDPNRQVLNVMSPIWTIGHQLEVEGYRLPLRAGGDLERVYTSGRPMIFNDLDKDPDYHGLLGELGVRNAIATPVRVEDRALGVLVIADRTEGPFTDKDLDRLVSLSTPTALAIAQLRRIQEAAETSRKMEELAAMKSDFVSVVSHELRTPLTSIIGSLATLARPELPRDSDMANGLLESARSQANRLNYLIEDLLIVSRIEGKALPMVAETVDLVPFLQDTVREVPDSGRVTVTGPSIKLTSDPEHIRRIMINLVQNAIRYAPESPIEVTADEDSDAVTISVVDHGPGIPVRDRERVFERFTQLESSATRRQGGTGLGLAIVRGLSSTIGGTVRIEDTPGGGATFEVWMPKVAPTTTAPRRAWIDQSSGGTATAIE